MLASPSERQLIATDLRRSAILGTEGVLVANHASFHVHGCQHCCERIG